MVENAGQRGSRLTMSRIHETGQNPGSQKQFRCFANRADEGAGTRKGRSDTGSQNLRMPVGALRVRVLRSGGAKLSRATITICAGVVQLNSRVRQSA
jgi:hypothetical protein